MAATATETRANPAPATSRPLLTLGVGDAVSVQVYGSPELNTVSYVSDDGTMPIPLAGNVPVAGLSPAQAGQRIAEAFRRGSYLSNPQVTVFLSQFRSQQVSVLGAVHTPGRFVVESMTTVLDALAQAGGMTDDGSDLVVLLRPDINGKVDRQIISLRGLSQASAPVPSMVLRGGDSIFVPLVDRFYLNGEVQAPARYRLEPGMNVLQAISLGGGVTANGAGNRIEIKRQNMDGSYATFRAGPDDLVMPDDVIRVKERIF